MKPTALLRRLCVLALCVGGAAHAAWPERPVTLVAGFAPGGATDIAARLIARSLSDALAQTVLVENRTGFGSNIAASAVARAAPDGYTFYVGSIANAINRALYKNLDYDLQRDFDAVALLGSTVKILVVHPALPIQSAGDYLARARQHPGELTCASSGNGSAVHLACELFKLLTGSDIMHVPYRGSGPAIVDLLGGQVDSMFDNLASSIAHVQSGRLRALAVDARERLAELPDVPTLVESGLPDLAVESWFAILAPAGVSPDIVATLNQAINAALASQPMRSAYAANSFMPPPQPNTAASAQAFIVAEIRKWDTVVRQAGLDVAQ